MSAALLAMSTALFDGVRDELNSLGVGVGRSNPGLRGSSPRVSNTA